MILTLTLSKSDAGLYLQVFVGDYFKDLYCPNIIRKFLSVIILRSYIVFASFGCGYVKV